jgi:hypothetical protein
MRRKLASFALAQHYVLIGSRSMHAIAEQASSAYKDVSVTPTTVIVRLRGLTVTRREPMICDREITVGARWQNDLNGLNICNHD